MALIQAGRLGSALASTSEADNEGGGSDDEESDEEQDRLAQLEQSLLHFYATANGGAGLSTGDANHVVHLVNFSQATYGEQVMLTAGQTWTTTSMSVHLCRLCG